MDQNLFFTIIFSAIGLVLTAVVPLVWAIIDRRKAKKQEAEAKAEVIKARAEAEAQEDAAKKAEAEAKAENLEKIAAEAAAKTAEAEADLLKKAIDLMDAAETTYKRVDGVLKAEGGKGAGAVKKDTVMTKLQSYALENKFPFDADKWSGVVDGLVKFTKNVNAC